MLGDTKDTGTIIMYMVVKSVEHRRRNIVRVVL